MNQKIAKDPTTVINGAGKYIVQMQGGLEPDITGPFESDEHRDEQAKIVHRLISDEDNLFALDIDLKVQKGIITLVPTAWSGPGASLWIKPKRIKPQVSGETSLFINVQ